MAENDEIQKIQKIRSEIKHAGILSAEKCDLYLKDISVAILAFILKIKGKMITSDMSFFSGYYLPSNVKMKNFSGEEARYVFETGIEAFSEYFILTLSLDSLDMVIPHVSDEDIFIHFL